QVADRVRGLGPDLDPVLDALFVEVDLLGLILRQRVVPAELFDEAPVAPGAAVHGVQAIERAVVTTDAGEAETNQGRPPGKTQPTGPPGRHRPHGRRSGRRERP